MRNSARDKLQRSWNTKTREHTAKMTREQIREGKTRNWQDGLPGKMWQSKSPEKRTSKWYLFFFWEALESRIMPSVGRSKEQASLPAAGDRGDQHRHSEKLASIFFFFLPQIKYFIPAAQLFPSWVNMSEQFSPGTRRGCVCLLGTAWPGGGGVVGIWLWLLWLEAGDSMYTSQDGDA